MSTPREVLANRVRDSICAIFCTPARRKRKCANCVASRINRETISTMAIGDFLEVKKRRK